MKRWVRNLLLYSPGIALLIAGVIELLTVPLFQPLRCSCPTGEVCSCPTGTVYHLEGPILVAASALYSSSVFIALRIAQGWFKHWPRPLNGLRPTGRTAGLGTTGHLRGVPPPGVGIWVAREDGT